MTAPDPGPSHTNPGRGQRDVPPGEQDDRPGEQKLKHALRNLRSGALNLRPGALNLRPGALNLRPGALNLRPPPAYPQPISIEPSNPLEAILIERIQQLEADIQELKTRVNWLILAIVGACLTFILKTLFV
jgi:hypothetical protein